MDRVVRMTSAALAAFALIGQAIGADTRPSYVEWRWALVEMVAKKNGERINAIGFEDPFDHRCPTGTILISSVDHRLGLIAPQTDPEDANPPEGQNRFSNPGPTNSPEFHFSNRKCQYVITMRKFSLQSDGETEIGPEPVDRVRQAEEMAKDLKAGNRTDPAPAESPFANPDPADEAARRRLSGGVFRNGMRFAADQARVDFSGILFFRPWTASVYLVNVPAEFTVEARKNPDKKTYDIDVKNSMAKLRFSIAKEVDVGGLWVRAFAD